MRNKLLLSITLLMCPTLLVLAQNTSNTGRYNWFPNQGSVGIGTRTPSKDLEVIGDLNVTGATSSSSMQTTTLQSGSLLNLNNAVINGKLGIGGISNPSEALDVLGNLKLSGNITAQGVNFQTLTSTSGTFGSLTVNQNVNVGGNIVLTNNLSALGITSTSVNTQTLTAGLATFDDNASFTKNIFVSGKLGIGVAQPNESLEVGGNIKSTGSLLSQSLTTGAGQLTSLLVNQNSVFNGLVGIGTNTPGEKLHVAGNIKADNTITSNTLNATNVQAGQLNSGAATFSDNISAAKDVSVTGKVGIGVASPAESLDVNGNLKLTGGITASSLNVNQGSFSQGLSAGNTSVNGTLTVTGQLTAQSLSLMDINATNNISVGKDFTVTGKSNLNGGATIDGVTSINDLQVSGTVNAKDISVTDVTTTGNATIGHDINVTGKGLIGSDLTVNGKLNAQSLSIADVTSTGSVSVGQNLTVSGATQLNGTLNTGAVSASSVTTTGSISTAQDLSVTGNTTLNNLTINGQLISKGFSADGINTQGSITAGQNLTVNGTTTVKALHVNDTLMGKVINATDVGTSGNLGVGSVLTVAGKSQLRGGAAITGNSTVSGDLSVTGVFSAGTLSISDINTNGSANVGQNLTVAGAVQVGGNFNASGNVKAGVIEANEFKKSDGTPLFNLDNTSITKTLAVAADHVPSDYKLAVGGNIIATGVDIKIPQKWPDYVFTDGHKLLTIDEVNTFIKEHGHLPGVLSASEMQTKQNYSVSEMDAKLLEKIEELTLYIINQNREMNVMKKEIEELKKK